MIIKSQLGFGEIRLLGPFSFAVRFAPNPAAGIAVHPHGTAIAVGMEGTAQRIDWNVTIVHPEAITLGIAVGEEAALTERQLLLLDDGHCLRDQAPQFPAQTDLHAFAEILCQQPGTKVLDQTQ